MYGQLLLLLLKKAYTVDLLPVVHCKDCRHCYYAINRVPAQQCYVCGKFGEDIGDTNFYCAYGEKK